MLDLCEPRSCLFFSFYGLTPGSPLTGKTLLAKTLARFVNVPFVIADATTLTQVTYLTGLASRICSLLLNVV